MNTFPLFSLGLQMRVDVIRVAVGLHLGLLLCCQLTISAADIARAIIPAMRLLMT